MAKYEILKAKWIAENPEATHEEYMRAMIEIARKCRV